MNKILHGVLTVCAVLLLAPCVSKETVVKKPSPGKEPHTSAAKPGIAEDIQELTFVQCVYDNQVYTQNTAGNMTFSFTRGGKGISAPGFIRMRKDKVIRLQMLVPSLGTEVGQIEFTPDGVLIVDRMRKECVRADYRELGFLRGNGLTFYSLRVFLWDQPLTPGKEKVSESDLRSFDVCLPPVGEIVPLLLKRNGMEYRWSARGTNGRILSTVISYQNNKHGKSTLIWNYDNFKTVGVKQFPAKQVFSFMTTTTRTLQQGQVTTDMNDVQTDSNWEERSTVSSWYEQMNVKAVLGKLLDKQMKRCLIILLVLVLTVSLLAQKKRTSTRQRARTTETMTKKKKVTKKKSTKTVRYSNPSTRGLESQHSQIQEKTR